MRRVWVLGALLLAGCTSAAHSVTPPRTSGPAPSITTRAAPATSRPPTSTRAPAPSSIPPVSAAARAVGFVDVRTIVPDAIIDMRYATAHNFTGVQLYPAGAKCLVHESMAAGLRTAAARLRGEGYLIVFWDCYRPHSVQVRMYQVVPNPNWVALPGPYSRSHETGRSVDVTLAVRATTASCPSAQRDHGHCLLDMGTGFDDFTPRAYAFTTAGITPRQVANRALLRNAMQSDGLTVYSGEWWHFDGPGAFVHRPIVDVPVD